MLLCRGPFFSPPKSQSAAASQTGRFTIKTTMLPKNTPLEIYFTKFI